MTSVKRGGRLRKFPERTTAFLTAGFRPFFFLAAAWSALAIPLWLSAYMHGAALRGALPAIVWHAHEMVYGFAVATVAGFLLTAIPNWTGHLPLQGAPLAGLAALWLLGRIALLFSPWIGPAATALADLAFLAAMIAAVARELIAGRNWRNLPMVGALSVLFCGNLLVHLETTGIAYTAALGNRIGIATLLALIALVGGRIVPSFTRNWLVKIRPNVAQPASPGRFDVVCLLVTVAGLVAWVSVPDTRLAWSLEIAGGVAAASRLSRWRGLATVREPLLLVLHLGYAWLAFGLVCLGLNGFLELAPSSAPLHALTAGAIGTMTLAVMTRASLGHSGRPLLADAGTIAIYVLVTAAALLRIAASLSTASLTLTALAGIAWSGAFGLFAVLYAPLLLRARAT